MLGEKIGEGKGNVISQRVLSVDGNPRMETSFREQGTLLGVESNNIGTYWSELRPNGAVYGEGQGVVMGKDGDAASWKGQGIGTPKPDGSISYRGALYYSTQSTKWSRLNTTAVVFEFEVDAEGKTTGALFEWK